MDTKNFELYYMHRPVADLAALKAIVTTNIVTGVAVQVLTMGDFGFYKTSSETADDRNIVTPTTGGGRWKRLTMLNFKTNAAGKIDPSILPENIGSPCRVYCSSNGTIATAFENGTVWDGVTLATNDRIIIGGQTDETQNGIYKVTVGAPTRDETGASLADNAFFVTEGTAFGNKLFYCTPGTITEWSTNIIFVMIGAGAVTAGTGLVAETAVYPDPTTKIAINYNNAGTWVAKQEFDGGISYKTNVTALGDAVTTANLIYAPSLPLIGTTAVTVTTDVPTGTARSYAFREQTNTWALRQTHTQNITINGTPTALTDAATCDYVQQWVNRGLWGASCRVKTQVAGTLASSFTAGTLINGVTLALNDRIMIAVQADDKENGIYKVTAGTPTRDETDDTGAYETLANHAFWVREGTSDKDTSWMCPQDTVHYGSTSISFVQTGAGVYTAGNGITITGNSIAINQAYGNAWTVSQTARGWRSAVSGVNAFADKQINTKTGVTSLATFFTIAPSLVTGLYVALHFKVTASGYTAGAYSDEGVYSGEWIVRYNNGAPVAKEISVPVNEPTPPQVSLVVSGNNVLVQAAANDAATAAVITMCLESLIALDNGGVANTFTITPA